MTDRDPDFDARCRRAACLFRLARATGNDDVEVRSTRLALIECHNRPGLKPTQVLSAADDIVAACGDDLQAALIAELAALNNRLGPFDVGDGAP